MREFLCSTCGQRVPSGAVCPGCAGFVKVTPPLDGPFRDGTPPVEQELEPSIRKEYHHSFLRIMVSFGLAWLIVLAIVAFFAWRQAR